MYFTFEPCTAKGSRCNGLAAVMADRFRRPPTPDPEPARQGEQLELGLQEKIRYQVGSCFSKATELMSSADTSSHSLQLYASGEVDRLKELLAKKLEACGWRDEIKERCRGA
jgi:hypothetical protein